LVISEIRCLALWMVAASETTTAGTPLMAWAANSWFLLRQDAPISKLLEIFTHRCMLRGGGDPRILCCGGTDPDTPCLTYEQMGIFTIPPPPPPPSPPLPPQPPPISLSPPPPLSPTALCRRSEDCPDTYCCIPNSQCHVGFTGPGTCSLYVPEQAVCASDFDLQFYRLKGLGDRCYYG